MRSIQPTKLYLALVRRLHFLVLLALLVPCFCLIATFGLGKAAAEGYGAHFLPLYALTLTLALPASFMYLLQERVKNLGPFLLCVCPAAFLFLAALCSLEMELSLSVRGAEQVPQALILLIYVLDAIRMRTNDNSRRIAHLQNDHSWMGDRYLLPLPALQLLIPFAAVYISALFLHSDALAQTALIGAVLYFFLVLPYHILSRKEAFLESRHHISRIPVRRIAQLEGLALVRLLLPCALLAAAAMLASGGRRFLELPAFPLNITSFVKHGGVYSMSPIWRFLIALGLYEPGAPAPVWLVRLIDFTENVLTVFMTAVLAYFFWLGARSLWHRFRRLSKDDGARTVLSELRDEHVSLKKPHRRSESGRGLSPIRRRYRRTILRALGESPKPWETPAMMEGRARLPDTPQMRELHDSYEQDRYNAASRS